MKSILEELYNDNLLPGAFMVPRNPGYRAMGRQIDEATERWRGRLAEEEYEELVSLLDLHHRMHEMDSTAAFVYGFKLGAAMMVEVMDGKEQLFRNWKDSK